MDGHEGKGLAGRVVGSGVEAGVGWGSRELVGASGRGSGVGLTVGRCLKVLTQPNRTGIYACTHTQEREADQAARQPQPFKPTNPPKRGGPGVPNTTISKHKGVAGEWEYICGADPSTAPRDPNNPDAAAATAATAPGAGAADAGPAFKPASLKPRHLGKQPEYIHDPEVPKIGEWCWRSGMAVVAVVVPAGAVGGGGVGGGGRL
mgnify:CR=1 FL=1